MTRRSILAAAVLLAAPLLVGGGSRPAGATPADPIDQARDAVLARVDARLDQLGRLASEVAAATYPPPEHRQALGQLLDGQLTAMGMRRDQVVATSDDAALAEQARAVVEDHRVYVLVTPQVHLALAVDRAGAFAQKLAGEIGPLLDAALAAAPRAGRDVGGATAARAKFGTDLQAVAAALAGRFDALVALTPAGYPDNRQSLLDARAALATARGALADAVGQARAVAAGLR